MNRVMSHTYQMMHHPHVGAPNQLDLLAAPKDRPHANVLAICFWVWGISSISRQRQHHVGTANKNNKNNKNNTCNRGTVSNLGKS